MLFFYIVFFCLLVSINLANLSSSSVAIRKENQRVMQMQFLYFSRHLDAAEPTRHGDAGGLSSAVRRLLNNTLLNPLTIHSDIHVCDTKMITGTYCLVLFKIYSYKIDQAAAAATLSETLCRIREANTIN
jgi:hypothetical protein